MSTASSTSAAQASTAPSQAPDEANTETDAISAQAAAQTHGHRVEDVSQRTETTQVFANPEGSWTSETATDPVRVKDDAGEWHDIDTTLVAKDGRLAPKYAATDLLVSGGGDKTFAAVSEDGRDLEWRWPTALPQPVVAGDTATYKDVAPGQDLVVKATSTGFEHSVVLKEAPAEGESIDLVTPVTTDGGKLSESTDGGLKITAEGQTVVSAPAPVMYDSSENQAGDPVTVALDTRVGETATGAPKLTLSADEAFLHDPATVYPVVVDPVWSTKTSGDTWAQTPNYTSPQVSDEELRVGSYDDGVHKARSFLHFGIETMNGNTITDAKLVLRNWSSKSCAGSTIRVRPTSTSWSANSLVWSKQPSAEGSSPYADYATAKGATGCAAGDATWNVTDIVKGWQAGTFPNYGLRVVATNENTTDSWRHYRSGNYLDAQGTKLERPRLDITFNAAPLFSSQIALSSCLDDCDADWRFTKSLTPTFQVAATDPEQSNLAYQWQLRTFDDEAAVTTGTSSAVAGATTSWTVPTGALQNDTIYEIRIGVSDSLDTTWGDWSPFGVDIDEAPAVAEASTISPCDEPCTVAPVVKSSIPTIAAVIDDPDSSFLDATFQVRRPGSATNVWSNLVASQEAGSQVQTIIPEGVLQDGQAYEYRIGSTDESSTTWTSWNAFNVQNPPVTGPTALRLTTCADVCSKWQSNTTSPLFRADLPTAANNANQATLRFEVRTGETTVQTGTAAVGTNGTAEWSVPEQTQLESGEAYEIRVGLVSPSTGSGQSWSGWQEFVISADVPSIIDSPASSEQEMEPDAVSEEPSVAPDPAADVEDAGTPSNYSDQDLLTLNADSEDDVVAARRLSVDPDSDFSPKKVPIWKKYAPVMKLHSDEKWWPMSADTFINHSKLRWAHTSCKDHQLSASPRESKMGDGLYTHQKKGSFCLGHDGKVWKSNENVAAFVTGGVTPGTEGMFLNLRNSWQDGDGFNGNEPVYYKYAANKSIEYWFNYGRSVTLGSVGAHEGDWEHISITLSKKTNAPKMVRYFYHYESCTLPWAKVPMASGTKHPSVWIAKGSHGSYPAHANTPSLKGHEDSINGSGHSWYATNNLKNATQQPWYGYAGGWGGVGLVKFRTGPSGPSPLKTSGGRIRKCSIP